MSQENSKVPMGNFQKKYINVQNFCEFLQKFKFQKTGPVVVSQSYIPTNKNPFCQIKRWKQVQILGLGHHGIIKWHSQIIDRGNRVFNTHLEENNKNWWNL